MISKVEELRNRLSLSCISYQKAIKIIASNSSDAILLFEGEDQKYYAGRISIISNYAGIDCGGKDNVIETMSLIRKNRNIISDSIFAFVDRDHDNTLNDDHIYETPTYSIENLYCSQAAFDRLLAAEMGVNKEIHTDLYCEIFEESYHIFNEKVSHLKLLSSWFKFQRDSQRAGKDIRIIAKNIKIKCLIEDHSKNPMQYVRRVCPQTARWNAADKLKYLSDKIHENPIMNYRGKWLMEIYIPLLNTIIDKARKKKFRNEMHKSPEIVIQGAGLSALSQYADTPECLTTFIKKIQQRIQQ